MIFFCGIGRPEGVSCCFFAESAGQRACHDFFGAKNQFPYTAKKILTCPEPCLLVPALYGPVCPWVGVLNPDPDPLDTLYTLCTIYTVYTVYTVYMYIPYIPPHVFYWHVDPNATCTCSTCTWTLMLPARVLLPARRFIPPPHVFYLHVDPNATCTCTAGCTSLYTSTTRVLLARRP